MVRKIGEPIDGGWGWLVAAAAFVTRLLMDGIVYSFGVMVVPLINYFGASRQELGWTGSLLAGTSLFLGPVASAACNYFGCRIVIIGGTSVPVFGMLVSSFADSPWMLTFTYGITVGLGSCFVLLPTVICVAYYFDKRQSLALGLSSCGSGFGTFIMGNLSEYLIFKFGWSGTMIIEAGLLLNCAALGLLFVEPPVTSVKPKQEGKQNQQTSEVNDILCKPEKDVDVSIQFKSAEALEINKTETLSQPQDNLKIQAKNKMGCGGGLSLFCYAPFMIFMVTSIFTCMGPMVPYMFLADRAFTEGHSQESSSALIPLIGVSNLIGGVVGGVLGDRKFVNKLALFITCIAVCGIIVCLIAIWTAYWLLLSCGILFGFFYGAVVTLLPVVLVDLVSMSQLSCAYGFGGFFAGLGVVAGPPIAGAIYDTTKSYTVTFLVMGLVTCFASLCNVIIFLLPSYKKDRIKKTELI